jgi:hypothetical protein
MTSALNALFDNVVVMLAIIFFAAWLIGHIVEEIRKYACHRSDVELKRDLADRGLSAQDIERIVSARSGAGKAKPKVDDGELVVKTEFASK